LLSHSSVVAMFLILAEPQTLHHGISAVMTNREENGESGPVATDLTVQVTESRLPPPPRKLCAGSRTRTPASPSAIATAASSTWRCTRRSGDSSGQSEPSASFRGSPQDNRICKIPAQFFSFKLRCCYCKEYCGGSAGGAMFLPDVGA